MQVYTICMRRIGLRLQNDLWTQVKAYGETAGLLNDHDHLDLSETIRDLIARGLSSDRTQEAGYRRGYQEGRLAGFADFMATVGRTSK